jgi:pimeloyl-ACP methyl ester carboxylesterase
LSKTSGGALAMMAAMAASDPTRDKTSDCPNTVDRFVGLEDGDMHVVVDGRPDAPALLLIHASAASLATWDLVVPYLAGALRVIRVDLLGCGKSSTPAVGYDITTQARRVSDALDEIGVSRVRVIGHSGGCAVATAVAEQRPDAVVALALIDFGPSLDAKIPENRLTRLVLTRFPGRMLWRMKTEATIRKSASMGFTRPVDIPDAMIEDALRMTHRAFVGAMRAPVEYLRQRSLPDRLSALGLPLLVIFGADDQRWRSSMAGGYRVVPGSHVEVLAGVGHTPILEDPETIGKLLLDFASATVRTTT